MPSRENLAPSATKPRMTMLPDAVIVPCSVSADVFQCAGRTASVDGAVIPIENSLAGSVLEHFDLLLQHDVKVVRESQLRIRHNLIGICVDHRTISTGCFRIPWRWRNAGVFSPPIPGWRRSAFYDTAGSVKQFVELRDRHAAAIASEAAAALLRRADSCRPISKTILKTSPASFWSGAPRKRASMPTQTRLAWRFPWRTGPGRWWRR